MKIVFMGSQEFSAEFLKLLSENNNYQITKVFTREAKIGGRNKQLIKTPVQLLCEKLHIPFETPKSLKNYDISQLQDVDLIVVVGYGLILPKNFIEYPKHQCINVHPSILPRWRGAAPIERAIWSGDKKTASIIMLMDEGLDTGDILSFEEIDIDDSDDSEILTQKILKKAKIQLIDVINDIKNCIKNRKKQSEIDVLYAEKLSNEDKKFDFTAESAQNITAKELKNRIRALSPKYGLMIKLKNLDEEFKIFQCDIAPYQNDKEHEIGAFHADKKSMYIACKDGYLLPKIVQKTNGSGKKIDIRSFIAGLSTK